LNLLKYSALKKSIGYFFEKGGAMNDNYPYFKDPRAMAEIRKHQWIESQKQGEEIGLATSALDWIEKYGQDWKKIYSKEHQDKGVFIEQRRYRRFKLDKLVKLVKDNITVLAEGINISFFGLMCRAGEFVPIGSKLGIYIPIEQDSGEKIICQGVIERSIHVKPEKYELFLRFDSECQQKLEKCKHFLERVVG